MWSGPAYDAKVVAARITGRLGPVEGNKRLCGSYGLRSPSNYSKVNNVVSSQSAALADQLAEIVRPLGNGRHSVRFYLLRLSPTRDPCRGVPFSPCQESMIEA
jgi:hypothetical protein